MGGYLGPVSHLLVGLLFAIGLFGALFQYGNSVFITAALAGVILGLIWGKLLSSVALRRLNEHGYLPILFPANMFIALANPWIRERFAKLVLPFRYWFPWLLTAIGGSILTRYGLYFFPESLITAVGFVLLSTTIFVLFGYGMFILVARPLASSTPVTSQTLTTSNNQNPQAFPVTGWRLGCGILFVTVFGGIPLVSAGFALIWGIFTGQSRGAIEGAPLYILLTLYAIILTVGVVVAILKSLEKRES
ncbi:MAG: hypothetical protein G01um1014106_133 [Parcubacteria group bacterium Gr01-1014_106]|nr:MAG: hypothetical protein G01um1014106_133 [Parcubacteria group bacterium Gr01-1014_106]